MHHDSFFHMHSAHIFETAIVLVAIAAWWYIAKKRR
jgi:cytochrome bd-type quinol oxidase subunit 1